MEYYKEIKLDKSMYKVSNKTFTQILETFDNTNEYTNTLLANMDAYQRQLKRFDIKVNDVHSDCIEKFFQTAQTATLFPEYVFRAVKTGAEDVKILNDIVAIKTIINGTDYRTIYIEDDKEPLKIVGEGAIIPNTTIKLKNNLVMLNKTGRMLVASYEAIKHQKIDLFTIALRQIGSKIAKQQLKTAINILTNGDGNSKPQITQINDELQFSDLIDLWNNFDDYKMNTILISPTAMKKLMELKELLDSKSGFDFEKTGSIQTLLGANLIKSNLVPEDMIIALDNRFALEMVCCGDIEVEYDKLIDKQLERAAITSIYGFANICSDAVKVLKLKK